MSRMNCFTPNSHRFIGKTITERTMKQTEIVNNNPFFMAVVRMYFIKLAPNKFPCHKDLLSTKYDVRLKTYALDELLGRPVPSVINLKSILDEAVPGDFTSLDKALEFVDDAGNEVEMMPLEQQQKMNDVMIKILQAQGLDFDAYIEEVAYLKVTAIKHRSKLNRKENKQKISKMKLKNQRRLGAVSKTASAKSAFEETETGEKGSSTPIKIKTAKDHEHYRKSKRPTRI